MVQIEYLPLILVPLIRVWFFHSIEAADIGKYDHVYKTFTNFSACVRRMNGTHVFGCSSAHNGNGGVLHFVESEKDLKWLLSEARAKPYIAALRSSMFNLNTLLEIAKVPNTVNGVILILNGTRPTSFSHGDTCPNRYSGIANAANYKNETCSIESPFNPFASSIMMRKWDFPIFAVKDNDTVASLLECFLKHNVPTDYTQVNRDLCSVELKSHMYANTNSESCLRRTKLSFGIDTQSYCDSLSDRNIFVPLYPFHLYKKHSENSLIIVSARTDSTSMFQDQAPGSLSTGTSVVILLYTAHLLFNSIPFDETKTYDKNIMFVLFNGEAYDYIGSSRMAYDMANGTFPNSENPMSLQDIKLFVDLSQIDQKGHLFYHNNPAHQQGYLNFLQNLTENMKQASVKLDKSNSKIPPTSFQSFLAENSSIPGFVLSSYDKQFTNRYYDSMFDDSIALNYHESDSTFAESIANYSTSLAKTLFTEINKKEAPPNFSANLTLVKELLDCYLLKYNCSLLATLTSTFQNFTDPINMQVGVGSILSKQYVTNSRLMVYLTGTQVPDVAEDKCTADSADPKFSYMWIPPQKLCLKSNVNYSLAYSPAFIIPEYDFGSNRYSTWTESVWEGFTMKMYLKASFIYEFSIFILGLGITIGSFVVVPLLEIEPTFKKVSEVVMRTG